MLGLIAAGTATHPSPCSRPNSEATRAQIVARHAHSLRALRGPVSEPRGANVDACLRLFDGVLVAVIEAIRDGSKPEGIVDAAATFVLGGVASSRKGAAGRRGHVCRPDRGEVGAHSLASRRQRAALRTND